MAGLETNSISTECDQYCTKLERELRLQMKQKLALFRQELEYKLEQEIEQQRQKLEQEIQQQLQKLSCNTVRKPTITDEHGCNIQVYEKATGVANMTGELYEVKMIALLFLRTLRKNQDFDIVSSLKAASAFDDIVFRFGDKTVLVQLKHRENTKKEIERKALAKEKGNFSLMRYYKSYCNVKQQWQDNKDLKQFGRFEDALFIVYTNATMAGDAGAVVVESRDWQHILGTGSGGISLHFTEETCPLKDAMMLEELPDFCKFLSQLIFFTEQAGESQLDEYIREEIKAVIGADTAYIQLVAKVQYWWRHSNVYLNEKIPFWQDIIQSYITNISQQKLNELLKLNLKFQENILEQFYETLHQSDGLLFVKTEADPRSICLTSLKVHQCLRHKCHLLVSGDMLNKHKTEILVLWNRWCEILVVVDDGRTPNYFLHSHSSKKLIHISGTEPENSCNILHDEVNLNQFNESSRLMVLNQCISFQSHDVPIGKIIGKFPETLPASIIHQLLENKPVLGDTLTGEIDYYIPRTLQLACWVRQDILSHKEVENLIILAVSGISCIELKKLMSSDNNIHETDNKCLIKIINSENDFTKLTDMYATVHWLNFETGNLMWKKSIGDMSILRKYLCTEMLLFKNVDSVIGIQRDTTVVSADPGMGKSTLLTHLAQETKKMNPTMWVIRLNLNDFTQNLDDLPNKMQLKDVVNFLLEASGIKSEWKALFRYKLNSMEDICLLFDGYDEISPTHEDKVATMLKILQKTKLKKLWITTRPVMRKKLEDELSTLALTLQPFLDKDQSSFLVKFWKNNNPDIEDSQLHTFITELLQLTARNLNDWEKHFTGVPLQSMLLAEAFEDDLKIYIKTGKIYIFQKFALFQLYNKFLDRRLEIYCDKNKLDLSKPEVLQQCEGIKKKFRKNHMISALMVLLPSKDLQVFANLDKMKMKFETFTKKIKEGNEKTGIIKQIVNNKPEFIHRTFVEYFAALWFAQNFITVKDYLRNKLFDPNFQIVRKFFDRILAQDYKLHVAVLNQDKDSVEAFLKEGVAVNERDKGGRTPLHLSVMQYQNNDNNKNVPEIIMALLEHEASIKIKDDVFCWSPLCLADKIQAWQAVNTFLGKYPDENDMIFTRKNINNHRYIQNILRVAAREGLVHIIAFMIKNGVQVGCPVSVTHGLFGKPECRTTMLHEAAEYGQLELVQFLVQNGADIEELDSEYNRTAIMWAAEQGEAKIVELLKKHGASISTCDKWGNTVLTLASCNGKFDIIKLLIGDAHVTTDILHCAAESGNVELVGHLLDLNLDIDGLNDYRETPLWRAAWFGQIKVIKLLCERGANIHVHCSMYSQFGGLAYTPLHAAVRRRHLDAVKYLVSRGANLCAQDSWGRTPLDVALWFTGNADVALFLHQQQDS